MRALVPALMAALALFAALPAAAHPANWDRPTAPFNVIGNVYYVGTEGLSAYLVTGPQGHVLIDGALPASAPLIVRNIRALGFKPAEVKWLLINHAHYDHAGGLAELKQLTGARLAASAADKPDLEAGKTLGRPDLDGFPPVKVDRVIADGDEVRVGSVALKAILTPGHTHGATSWTTMAGGKRVIFASSLSVAGQPLVGDRAYPAAASDFRRTFARLRAERADVFLNFHAEGFDMEKKRARKAAGDAAAFVDPGELARQAAASQRAFETELAKQQRR